MSTPRDPSETPLPPGETPSGVSRRLTAVFDEWLAPLTRLGADGALIRRNFGWLLADRAFRLMVGLVVNAWLVRYLGAEQLGLMSFSQSVVVLFGAISTLGLETILVRDLVRRPEHEHTLVGTALGLRLLGSVLVLFLALFAVGLMRPGQELVRTLTLIFTITSFAQAFDVVEFWFQSRSHVAPVVGARLAAFVVGAIAKVIAILCHAPLVTIAAILAGEYVLSSLALLVACRMNGGAPERWRFTVPDTVLLLRESWPLIINSVAIIVSVRVDQMLLTTLRGPAENGVFAAAQRLTEIIYYVPVAIMAAASPTLLKSFERDRVEYAHRLQRLFRALALSGTAIAVGVSLLAGPITLLLFGSEFRASGAVLAIQVWSAPILFLGIAQTNWFIAHGRQRALMVRSVVAAIASVALNLWLVPLLGARGAAITMVVSQTIAQFLLNACFAETRPLFLMQCRAFVPGPLR